MSGLIWSSRPSVCGRNASRITPVPWSIRPFRFRILQVEKRGSKKRKMRAMGSQGFDTRRRPDLVVTSPKAAASDVRHLSADVEQVGAQLVRGLVGACSSSDGIIANARRSCTLIRRDAALKLHATPSMSASQAVVSCMLLVRQRSWICAASE